MINLLLMKLIYKSNNYQKFVNLKKSIFLDFLYKKIFYLK